MKVYLKYTLHFYQGGIGLPDRDYYFNTDSRTTNIRKEYKDHLKQMFYYIWIKVKARGSGGRWAGHKSRAATTTLRPSRETVGGKTGSPQAISQAHTPPRRTTHSPHKALRA